MRVSTWQPVAPQHDNTVHGGRTAASRTFIVLLPEEGMRARVLAVAIVLVLVARVVVVRVAARPTTLGEQSVTDLPHI